MRNRRGVNTPTDHRAGTGLPDAESRAEEAPTRIIVDHVDGARRGQRQEFVAPTRLRFGRHPECEVSFDAHRDIDASSRHAELRAVDASWVLVDLGSSNGTFVEGRRTTEAPVLGGVATMVEFGSGGPRLRLFIGDDAAIAALPPPPRPRRSPWRRRAAYAGAVASVFLLLLLIVRAC